MTNYVTTREVPWMKIGKVIDEPMTAAEAAEMSGMNFDIKLEPAGYYRNGTWHEKEDRFAIIRDDTNEFFNFCSSSYAPIQYSEAFDFMDQINTKYVAAGTMRGGRQAFVVVELPGQSSLDLTLNGKSDPHELYVVLRAGHDMSKGIEVAVTTLRHKCMNALTLSSMLSGAQQHWSIRHTRSAHEKLAQAQRVLSNSDKYVEEFKIATKRLANVNVADEQAQMILEHVLPDIKSRDEKQIPDIMNKFHDDTTNGFGGTGWGLVNAVSEYLEWGRTQRRTDESRFRDDFDGATHKYTNQVAELVMR